MKIHYCRSLATSLALWLLQSTATVAQNAGVGTTAPQQKLHIAGPASTVRIDGVGGAGTFSTPGDYALYATANGDVTRVPPTAAPANSVFWNVLGNAGTIAGVSFIGTTDAQSLMIRTNNAERVRITQKGQLEILNSGLSVFIGEGAGSSDDLSSNRNVFAGNDAGNSNTTGDDNVAVGFHSLRSNTTGIDNIAIGAGALTTSIQAQDNTAVGHQAMSSNISGSWNAAFGAYTLDANTTGNRNSAFGSGAGGLYTNGNNNTFLGYGANAGSAGLSNSTALGANAIVSASNSLVLGNGANVGIGTSTPSTNLHVEGGFRLVNGTQSEGRVLTSDSIGGGTWKMPVMDLAFPQGTNGQFIIQTVDSANTYTVPATFNLYITKHTLNAPTEVYPCVNGIPYPANTDGALIFPPGTVISGYDTVFNYFQCSFVGMLIAVDSYIQPVNFPVNSNTTYTVPTGKKLVLYAGVSGITVNGHTFPVGLPFTLPSGSVVGRNSSQTLGLTGYLLDQ